MIQEKVVLEEFFDAMQTGKKPFEVCLDDRNPKYAVGDILIIHEVVQSPYNEFELKFTGRFHNMGEITYKLSSKNCPGVALEPGYCILGFGQTKEN